MVFTHLKGSGKQLFTQPQKERPRPDSLIPSIPFPFPAFLPQSALHQQLEKPSKLQELQWVSEIDGGGGTGKGEMA